MSTFHIVFPKGERDKLTVIELSDACHYELNDYAVASRKEFYSGSTMEDENIARNECVLYAKELAKEHNLTYIGDSDGYLD